MLAALMGGCVPVVSLHPLYTKEDVVFDKKLLGTWVDDPNEPDSSWHFESVDELKNAYKLVFTGKDGSKGLFLTYLVKLKSELFLDIYPGEPPWGMEDPNKVDWPINSIFIIPTHMFMKVDSIGPKLKMRLMGEPPLKKLLEENPDAIAHAVLEENLVLTASTKELQAFVLKYADGDKLFTDEIVLERKN